MTPWIRFLAAVLFGAASLSAFGQACTTTLSSGGDLQGAINSASAGQTICLNAGTYNGTTNGGVVFPANGGFSINKNIVIRGTGASPASVVLQNSGNSNLDHLIYFCNISGGNANGAQLINLTIQGAQGGVQIYNFGPCGSARHTDIKLKDIVITTLNTNPIGFGVLARSADRVVLDNVTITSNQTAINFLDVTDSLVMNSTVNNTVAPNAAALSVLSGSSNRFVNNSFGQPRVSPGAGYSFNGGGIVFYNTSDNRFEGNLVQGMSDDALDFTIDGNVAPVQKSVNNYVGKNHISHTAFALNGLVLGSSGIWSNCASDGTWMYGNETHGAAECGICIWDARSNMALGNVNYANGISGIFVSGGQESLDNCAPGGNLSFRQKPQNNFLMSNANYFNKNDQVVVRDADNTDITRSFSSPNNGLGGPLQGCTNPACQAAWSIETDATPGRDTSNGTRILANINLGNARGLWAQSSTTQSANSVTGIDFYLNRSISSTNSRWVSSTAQTLDRGSILGGNYWSQFIPTGNPSATPFTGVFHNTSNATGNVVDRFPYQSENLGRGYSLTVFEPRSGATMARGTKRTVRWDSVGCVFVDLTLNGTPLATNFPNIGYAVLAIPPATALGNTNILATCKDASGGTRGSVNSPIVTITDGALTLVSPGRDDVFNAGGQIWVGWKNTNPNVLTSVSIDASIDGGANWSNIGTVSGISSTNPVTSTRVTLPVTGSANAMLRVRSGGTVVACGSNCDETDGVFSQRGASGAFDNVSAGRIFVMGQMERLEWSSPANSRLVTINGTVGGQTRTVATDLPDRGYFDWIVPDFGSGGTLSLTINYKTLTPAGSGAITSVTNPTSGLTRYPTTITFGTVPSIAPGQSVPISVSTNSGAGVTLTSNTPSICTVTNPNTINGIANGVCSLTANAAATGAYTTANPSSISFNIGNGQTITFNAPGFIAVGSTITLSATASSGLQVVFSSLTPSVCSISGGNQLTGNTVGTCTVAADQPGNGTYAAAAQVQRTLQSVAGQNLPRLVNISTRMKVLTGSDVLIGGFVIGGSAPKTVVIRARGPSLASSGISNFLADPVLQLFSGPTQIAANNNWQEAQPNANNLQASGFQPDNPFESAIYITLNPGAYTAIVTGAGGGTGVGLIEVFEVDHPELALINISTRGQVLTGNDVMIAGFIIQGQASKQVVIRARGPSLTAQGVPGVLANPQLFLYTGSTEIASNDNWQSAGNAATLQSLGYQPDDPNEAAILITLAPGAYTAIVNGVGGTTGVAIVEVFGL